MIVLDTNIVSATMTKSPDPVVHRFLASRPVEDFALTALTIFELRFGIARLPMSVERRRLTVIADGFAGGSLGPILSLDMQGASLAAAFRAERQKAGRPVAVADSLIAGIALRHRATLATRNIRDFDGADLDIIDPWQGGSA